MDWRGVDYLRIIVMFLSAVWMLILMAPIYCRWSIGEQVMEYISPNMMKKQTHLHLGWPDVEHNFIFRCNLLFFCLFHENLLFLLETTLINKMHSKCIVSDGPLFLDYFSFLCFS